MQSGIKQLETISISTWHYCNTTSLRHQSMSFHNKLQHRGRIWNRPIALAYGPIAGRRSNGWHASLGPRHLGPGPCSVTGFPCDLGQGADKWTSSDKRSSSLKLCKIRLNQNIYGVFLSFLFENTYTHVNCSLLIVHFLCLRGPSGEVGVTLKCHQGCTLRSIWSLLRRWQSQ